MKVAAHHGWTFKLTLARVVSILSASLLIVACGGENGALRGVAERGEQLYMRTTIGETGAPGCITCHSLEPEVVKVGPSHAAVADRAARLVDSPDYEGQAETAEEYLRESILDPNAHIVPGFTPGVMYQRYAEVLTEQQVDDLVAYLMTLK